MPQLIDQISLAALLFTLIFTLNLVPAFAPPTWVTLSFIGLTIPTVPHGLLTLTAAIAATLGRMTLAKLSRLIVRGKFLSEHTRTNIDVMKGNIEKHKVFTSGMFLAYAFSPLPSNYLFIAYGLTTLRLSFIAVPFFIGRLVSYSFWVTTASAVGDRLQLDSIESASYVGIYFVASQILLWPAIYTFTKIDWHVAFEERKLRWLKTS